MTLEALTRRARKDPELKRRIQKYQASLVARPYRCALPRKNQRELGILPKLP
jgi:hypothetical protein